jgi:hypothetical protein
MKKLLNVIETARRKTRKEAPGVAVEAWRP